MSKTTWAQGYTMVRAGGTSSLRTPAWKESLKRIEDGETRDRLARASRKEMENIKAAKQVQASEYADATKHTKVPTVFLNDATNSLRRLAWMMEERGMRMSAAHLHNVVRNIVEPLREDA